MQGPLEQFLARMGYFRPPPLAYFASSPPRSPPPLQYCPDEFSPGASGLKLKRIRTRVDLMEDCLEYSADHQS